MIEIKEPNLTLTIEEIDEKALKHYTEKYAELIQGIK